MFVWIANWRAAAWTAPFGSRFEFNIDISDGIIMHAHSCQATSVFNVTHLLRSWAWRSTCALRLEEDDASVWAGPAVVATDKAVLVGDERGCDRPLTTPNISAHTASADPMVHVTCSRLSTIAVL